MEGGRDYFFKHWEQFILLFFSAAESRFFKKLICSQCSWIIFFHVIYFFFFSPIFSVSLVTFLIFAYVWLCEWRTKKTNKIKQKLRKETRGRHCLRPHLCVSPSGWQPCVRVSTLFSRWSSKLLPGSLWSQRSLTKAGVLTAWGPAVSLLWLGLWGLWGL